MTKKDAIKVVELLKEYYPDATCSLDFETPFQMVVAVMLSAQCTDERVNKTTPALFAKYGTPEAICKMKLSELEKIIHPCGFYKNKAKNVKATAEMIMNNYGGVVPSTMEELMKLPGVGRKSANVIMLEAFNSPQGIAVDTHAKRVSNKLGFSKNTDPEKIEMDLLKVIPKEYYYDVEHIIPVHTHVINKHIYNHTYKPQFTCSEESQVINNECPNNFMNSSNSSNGKIFIL